MKRFINFMAAAAMLIITMAGCNKEKPAGELVMEYEEIPSFAVQNCQLTLADKSGASTVIENVEVISEVNSRTASTLIYDKFGNEMMRFTDTDAGIFAGYLSGKDYKELMCIIIAHTGTFTNPTEFSEEQIISQLIPTSPTTWSMRYVRQFSQQ